MKIWIDGDACPKAIRQIIFRAAVNRQIVVTIVANNLPITPPSTLIHRVLVEKGFDKADLYIEEQVQNNDLVITADILLAEKIIHKKAYALNPRGMLYTEENIKQVVSVRDLNEFFREGGLIKGGQDTLGAKEVQKFANQLDKLISQYHRPKG
ncbi:MAG: DUF188 domain-containing protein [Legionella sp. 40-6]|nr:YaiI/YqxD family protein [Legionella sp.]OJY02558.1 MAG: DUF188 domain-containing protein [Legionella sp. 40-6]